MPRLRHILQPAVVLVIMMLVTLVAFDRPLVRGDGVGYLAWIDSIVIDGDVNLDNQADKFGGLNTAGQIVYDWDLNRWVSVFPFGIVAVQGPFYWIGHQFAEHGWWDGNADYFIANQGVERPYSLWLMIGANVMALLAVLATWQVAKRFADPMTSSIAVYAVFIGTPIVYYSTVSVLYSHNPAAFTFAGALLILAGISLPPETNQRPYFMGALLGILAGLTVLIRWQLLLAFIPMWGLLAWERRWKEIAMATFLAALILLPLPLVFHEMYDKWLVVPYDEANNSNFLRDPLENNALDVAWTTLKYSPILILSLLGIPVLWKRNRPWSLMLAAMIALQLIINGAALDWNAGESYGMRRMSELYAVYALLAAVFVGYVIKHINAKFVRTILMGIIAFQLIYILAFFHFTWTHPSGQFQGEPVEMINFLRERDRVFRWQLMEAVLKSHVGPYAWDEPGP